MNFWRRARVLGILILGLICVSCGDQYRPVAVPIVPPPPDPQAIHFVLVFSINGAIDPGRQQPGGCLRRHQHRRRPTRAGPGPRHAASPNGGSRVRREHPRRLGFIVFSDTRINRHRGRQRPLFRAGSRPVFVHTSGERHGLRRELREQHRRSDFDHNQCCR